MSSLCADGIDVAVANLGTITGRPAVLANDSVGTCSATVITDIGGVLGRYLGLDTALRHPRLSIPASIALICSASPSLNERLDGISLSTRHRLTLGSLLGQLRLATAERPRSQQHTSRDWSITDLGLSLARAISRSSPGPDWTTWASRFRRPVILTLGDLLTDLGRVTNPILGTRHHRLAGQPEPG